ncbi:MAG: hypothetical protein JW940_19200 [Polyangiaceae bacterium]|nr:hypothetical protein [Polyangiaceae bacterium]
MAKRVVLGMSRLAVVVAVGVLVGAGCGGSSGEKEADNSGSAGDGAGGSGGTTSASAGKASGGKGSGGVAQAGAPSVSAGSSPGGSGPTTDGTSHSAGEAPDGGTGGSSPPTGGTPSAAGASLGTGGVTLPEPEVGTVGTSCSEPGALQCAGTHQRVVVTCNGDGEWEAFESCPVGQYCDTRPGATLGSCQEPVAECVGKEPGETFCQNEDLYACGPDTITAYVAEDCVFCIDGQCADREECPSGTNWVNCSKDCADAEYACTLDEGFATSGQDCPILDAPSAQWELSLPDFIRTPAAADACQCGDGTRIFTISYSPARLPPLRLTVRPPWTIKGYGFVEACSTPAGGQCLIADKPGGYGVVVSTEDASAPPTNMKIEALSGTGEETCP